MKTDIVYKFNELNICHSTGLKSHRLFSQGNYYDADMIQFGTLRLLNNNHHMGISYYRQHYGNDLEMIVIPLTGEVEYSDSKANRCIIKKDELLTVTMGSGLCYSVNGVLATEVANYLKIGILPRKKGSTPLHHVDVIDVDMTNNRFHYIVAPDISNMNCAVIGQDAWVAQAQIDPALKVTYHKKKATNGIFILVCDGEIKVRGHHLYSGDCIAFDDKNTLVIEGIEKNNFLLLEVPMAVTLYNSDEKIVIPAKV